MDRNLQFILGGFTSFTAGVLGLVVLTKNVAQGSFLSYDAKLIIYCILIFTGASMSFYGIFMRQRGRKELAAFVNFIDDKLREERGLSVFVSVGDFLDWRDSVTIGIRQHRGEDQARLYKQHCDDVGLRMSRGIMESRDSLTGTHVDYLIKLKNGTKVEDFYEQ